MDLAFNIIERLLYKDALILIVDKPAGMASHAGRGPAPNIEQYFGDLRFGLPAAPALAHRLDKQTSGCLILGRHKFALKALAHLFSTGQVKKTYLAFVHGIVKDDAGIIDWPLKNITGKRYHWRMQVSENGKPACTEYQVLQRFERITFVRLSPKTGRTHQLRVHTAAMGWPIVGDCVYGDAQKDSLYNASSRMHLHASKVHIPLYPKKEPIVVASALPHDMQEFLERLEQ